MSEGCKNPFPGLRPFKFHEHELFFGRGEQYEQMIAKLSKTRFLAVVGTSGSGKSSLVRAGLLPALYGGQMMSAGPSWRVAVFRPKDDPIRELALALNHRRVFGDRSKENGSSLFKLTESIDWSGLCSRVGAEAQKDESNPSGRIVELLSSQGRRVLSDAAGDEDIEDEAEVVQTFNEILKRRDFYQLSNFQTVTVTGETRELLTQTRESLTDAEIEKLNRLLLEASYPQEIAKKGEIQAQITEVTLRRGDLGLVAAAREAKMSEEENLLVVVDQFEELFRYAKISEHGPHGNQAAAFVKLLLQASAQKEIPIYVVLTMRSDYLGDCAKFWDLPEAINEGQYLIPRLTRDQRREAIKGPIKLCGADITPQLVNQLLNDMGDDPDQLPILQHALMRTWDSWENDHHDHEPLDVRHYDKIGRMAEALSIHADEAYKELPDERTRDLAEQIFRCLTERATGHRETRRPTSVRDIRAITNAKLREIVSVINVFRQEGRSFVLPSARKPLKRETSIDISHESLIRNWTKLKGWVDREARSANIYRRLVETAKLHQHGEAGVLTDLEVQYAVKWKETNKPNLAWASRYHSDLAAIQKSDPETTKREPTTLDDREIFEGAMSFLEKSQWARNRKARVRKISTVLIAASVILVLGFGWVMLQNRREKERMNRENAITMRLAYSAEMNRAQREFDDGNFAKVNHFLQDPNDILAQNTTLRGFEWYHLWLLSHNELETLSAHNSPVISVIVPNGSKVLAVSKGDGTVELEHQDGKKITMLGAASAEVSTIGVSPDGKRVGIGRRDGSVELWHISDDPTPKASEPELLKQQNSDSSPVLSLTFSPDSKLLAVGKKSGVVKLWDTAVAKELPEIRPEKENPAARPEKEEPASIAFSPDGKSLAIGRTGKVNLVAISTREVLTLELNKSIPSAQNAEPVPVSALAYSADSRTLVMGRSDSTVVLWDLPENRFLLILIGHAMEVQTVALNKDGILATGSRDGSIKLWNLEWLFNSDLRRILINRNSSPESAAIHSPRAKGSTEPDRAAIQRQFFQSQTDISKMLLTRTLNGHAGAVKSVAFLPNQNRFVTGGQDGTVRLWEARVDNARNATVSLGQPSAIGLSSIAFSADGKMLATGSYDGSIELWDTSKRPSEAGSSRRLQKPGAPPVLAVAFSPDAQVLATGSFKSSIVTLWNLSTGLKAELRDGHKDSVLSIAFSPDRGMIATGSADKTVALWDINTSKMLRRIDQSGAVLALAFSSDGKTLAIGSTDRNVRLWDMDRGEVSAPLRVIISTQCPRLPSLAMERSPLAVGIQPLSCGILAPVRSWPPFGDIRKRSCRFHFLPIASDSPPPVRMAA